MESNKIKLGGECFAIENVLPKFMQDRIAHLMLDSETFDWYRLPEISNNVTNTVNYDNGMTTDDGGFFHLLYTRGALSLSTLRWLRSILDFFSYHTGIEVEQLMRVRARYTSAVKGHTKDMYAFPHVDYYNVPFGYSTFVYYVNDSDGDTFLFNEIFDPKRPTEEQVHTEENPLTEMARYTPKKGNGVYFNGHRFHAGNYPVDYTHRLIINFDFIEKKV